MLSLWSGREILYNAKVLSVNGANSFSPTNISMWVSVFRHIHLKTVCHPVDVFSMVLYYDIERENFLNNQNS